MHVKQILHFTQIACIAASLFGTSSFGFDLSLLKNDKEAKTHAYTIVDRELARRKIKKLSSEQDISQKAYALLGQSINELESSHRLCDLNLYRLFISKLEDEGIPSDPKTVIDLLIVWRDQNLIDDLFFEIMDQTSALDSAFETTFIRTSVSTKELSVAEWALTKSEISDPDFASLFDDFQDVSLENPGCSATDWMRVARQLQGIAKGKNPKKLRSMIALAQSTNLITDEAFQLLELYRLNEVQEWDLDLARYLDILKNTKNTAHVDESPLVPNRLSSKFKDRKSSLTYRASLYYHFNSTQIGMISDLLKKTFKRMDATKTEVTFTYQDGNETLPISPMGQYYLARKLLRKDLIELSQSSFFKNAPITHEDLLTAALETGLISADLLESALKIDDLWNPNVPRWKKITDFAFNVTGTATLFLPPPYNVIASIVLVFTSGQIGKKTAKPDPKDNPNDIF